MGLPLRRRTRSLINLGSRSAISNEMRLSPAIAAYSPVLALVRSWLALPISARLRSPRVAGLGLFGWLVVLELVRAILSAMFRLK